MPKTSRDKAICIFDPAKRSNPEWRVHTQRILAEVLQNRTCEILRQPLTIMDNLMRRVASRASELNDPELNRLMIQLTLYAIADPYSRDYAPRLVEKLLNSENVDPNGRASCRERVCQYV